LMSPLVKRRIKAQASRIIDLMTLEASDTVKYRITLAPNIS
jgi:hypothetical protein